MTFNANVPNAAQSPGLFPPQNGVNFTRLKTIINADHVFNDTAQGTDGFHRQMTMVAKAVGFVPPALPSGSNGYLYNQIDSTGLARLRYWDGAVDYALTPTDISITGSVTINDTNYVTIAAVPGLTYGEVFLTKGVFIQVGAFSSNNSGLVNAYSYAEKYISGSSATDMVRLGFGANASGLNIRVKNESGDASFNGAWTFRIFYRAK